jgi:hypothetical protein
MKRGIAIQLLQKNNVIQGFFDRSFVEKILKKYFNVYHNATNNQKLEQFYNFIKSTFLSMIVS